MLSMGPVFDLDRLKTSFTSLVMQAEPDILPAFMLWVDLKVSEFKVKGTLPPPSDYAESHMTKDISHSYSSVKEERSRDRCNNIDSYKHDTNMATSRPQDYVTDLSMKTALKAAAAPRQESMKSVIDNIVKKETLADHPTLPMSLPYPPPLPSKMHLPVTLPFLPPAGSSLAHTHLHLAKMLAQGPPLLPPPGGLYGDIPDFAKVMKHALPEPEKPANHKRFCARDMASLSEEAVCLKKSKNEVPPPMSVAQEASCYPRPESSPITAPATSYESSYPAAANSYPAVASSYPAAETYPDADCAVKPESCSPTKNRVTSALRDLLTAKLSSQHAEEDPEAVDKLVIDEDRASASDSDMGGQSPLQHPEDEAKHPNKCGVCGQMFQYRSSFRRHMKVHQGIFSHVCAVCGRKFTRKEHFIRHKCSRKPNKASRGAHTEISGQSGTAIPKVEFPPLAAGQSPSHRSEVSMDGSMSEYGELPQSPAMLPSAAPSQAPAESRRKAAVPRKFVMVDESERQEESFEEEPTPSGHDYQANSTTEYTDGSPARHYDTSSATPSYEANGSTPSYEGPVSAPSYLAAASPVSLASPAKSDVRSVTPESLCVPDMYYSPRKECPTDSYDCDEALDLSRPPVTSSSPSKDAPLNLSSVPVPPSQQEFTIDTGSYKVVTSNDPQGGEDRGSQFIKVVKQGNYLRLKEEAQVIAGQLCFVCPTCSKVFHRSSNFSRHMRIHRGVYSYVCPNCQRGFFRREHFQKHKCSRRGMSHTWDRKTKIDMVLAANGGQEGSDAEGGSESEESYPGVTDDHHDDGDLVIAEEMCGNA